MNFSKITRASFRLTLPEVSTLCSEDGQRTEAGCSAHSGADTLTPINSEDIRNTVLDIYRDLYKIEKDIKDQPKEFRLAVRRKKSKPLVKQLRTIISCARTKLNPSHELMAINYTLNHWLALTGFSKIRHCD
ncbi:MAG: transposase [Candidatus Obscuribacterales bacterium]